MAWTKRFTNQTATQPQAQSPLDFAALMENRGTYRNYESTLPEVYIGHPNRSERYNQYEQMDMDSEISAALEIISDFCTQNNIKLIILYSKQYKTEYF